MRGERVSAGAVARAVNFASRSRRRRARDRLVVLVCAVEPELDSGAAQRLSTLQLITRIEAYLREPTPAKMWLTIAVLTATYPLESEVIQANRIALLDGATALLPRLLLGQRSVRAVPAIDRRTVEVVADGVLVDVDHTSTVDFATGIQRVVRETVSRWVRDHDPILVGWTPDRTALRRLSDSEVATAIGGGRSTRKRSRPDSAIVVPWGATYFLPELNINQTATRRLAAFARWTVGKTGVIGFDLVPFSSPETTDPGMPAAFANNLVAVRHMDQVVAISRAAAVEYEGWRTMLGSAGIEGPIIRPVLLGDDHGDTSAIRRLIGRAKHPPLVLCVGSHEPRKNHLAVLHASEVLWGQGERFSLVFVGGNAWMSEAFIRRVTHLADRGRQVELRTAVNETELDELYRTATFTIFPSLNEGYGLPVIESLKRGTPVITSRFGSMSEVSSSGGTIYVDPRDDSEIGAAIRLLIHDASLRTQLSDEATARSSRSWDQYANDVWGLIRSEPGGRSPAA